MSFRASISSIKPKIALAYTLLLKIQLEERGQEWLKEQLNHFTSTDMKNIIVVFFNHCQGVEESNSLVVKSAECLIKVKPQTGHGIGGFQ